MAEPDQLLAAELAFGLLDPCERLAAERLRATDSRFADEVAKWETIAQTWIDELPEHSTSPQLLDNVTGLIASSRNVSRLADTAFSTQGPGYWRPLAIAASVLAALFAGLLVSRPDGSSRADFAEVANPVGRFSVAQIGGAADPHLATVLYDRKRGILTIRIAAIAPGATKVPEIWLINGSNAPQSLGFGQAGAAIRMKADARLKGSIIGGATLAITLEPVSSQPHAAPSSKILGTGTISQL